MKKHLIYKIIFLTGILLPLCSQAQYELKCRRKFIKWLTLDVNYYKACIPVPVKSDTYTGLTAIYNDRLYAYYRSGYLVGIPKGGSLKAYHKYIRKLLLKGDTIHLSSDKLFESYYSRDFAPVPLIDSILNYPKEKKEEFIDKYFGDDDIMEPTHGAYGTVIVKLFEWNIGLLCPNEYNGFRLFDYGVIREIEKSIRKDIRHGRITKIKEALKSMCGYPRDSHRMKKYK